MSHTPDQAAQYAPVKYHDGRSPSAWALSIGCMIGSVIIAIGAVGGPNWTTIIVGLVVCVISMIVAAVMTTRGLSNRA